MPRQLSTTLFPYTTLFRSMIIADKFGPKKPSITSLDDISYSKALKVGFIQCLSLWPGFSRSGSTISGGVLLGLDHKTARSEEHTSELQSRENLVCRLLLEK